MNKQINDIQPFILSNDDSYGKRERVDGNDDNDYKNEGNKKRRKIKGGAVIHRDSIINNYNDPLVGVSTLKKVAREDSIRPKVALPEVALPKVVLPEVALPEVNNFMNYDNPTKHHGNL